MIFSAESDVVPPCHKVLFHQYCELSESNRSFFSLVDSWLHFHVHVKEWFCDFHSRISSEHFSPGTAVPRLDNGFQGRLMCHFHYPLMIGMRSISP
jgi:hypothetical protein